MLNLNGMFFITCFAGLPVAIAATVVFWNKPVSWRSMPLHASCKVDWTFEDSCGKISQAVVDQMKKWETADNCKSGGERCLYKLTSQTETEIRGTHETPVKHYIDDLTFALGQDGTTCKVQGYSTSETWYAVLDYGTNYCNLHNLITGAGLDKSAGYTEKTSDSQCTQYSSADCEKY